MAKFDAGELLGLGPKAIGVISSIVKALKKSSAGGRKITAQEWAEILDQLKDAGQEALDAWQD